MRAGVHDGFPEAVRQVENWDIPVQAVGPHNVLEEREREREQKDWNKVG